MVRLKYLVLRDGREFGPYSLDELRRYVAEGRIRADESVREAGAGGRSFASVLDLTGPVDAAPRVPPVPPAPAGGTSPYAAPATWSEMERAPGGPERSLPMPPDMHWGVLFLLCAVTCGLFWIARILTQAVYARKVVPECRAPFYYAIYLLCVVAQIAFGGTSARPADNASPLALLATLAGFVFVIAGHFSMKAALEEAFRRNLSGVMTFFFNVLYFQWHMHDVANDLKAGRPFSR